MTISTAGLRVFCEIKTMANNNVADRENVLVNALESALSSNRVAIRLPSFIAADPELWFSLVERCFASSGVTSDDQKFSSVAQVLDSRVALEVRDIIVNVPETNAYETLKTQIIKRLSSSQEQKTRRLLEMEEMGDRKPSQFLRHLQGLAGTAVPESMLRTLWFSRLPDSLQPILAAQKDLSLERVADLADSIIDLTGARQSVAAAAAPAAPAVLAAAPAATVNSLAEQLSQILLPLREEIASIRQEMTEFKSRSSQPRGRSRSRARSRSRGPFAGNGTCWYHARYGPEAKKCTQPCTFNTGNGSGSR